MALKEVIALNKNLSNNTEKFNIKNKFRQEKMLTCQRAAFQDIAGNSFRMYNEEKF
jgi:hypothetical protein